MPLSRLLLILSLCTAPMAARAEVLELQPGGFVVRHRAEVPLDPGAVWVVMMERIAEWWHPDHSWSADAGNLYIDARLGGCFCERLPASGGAVEHLRITYFEPGRMVRMEGALGPLSDMAVQGRMTWQIESLESGDSRLTFTYRVHGMRPGGFEDLATAVDGVIGQQHRRLVELATPAEYPRR